jgi:hypothetical protein
MVSCVGILTTEIINAYYDTRAVGPMEAHNHKTGPTPIQSRVFESTACLSILAESKPTITAPSMTITGVVM